MFSRLFTKTKKAVLLSAVSLVTLVAAGNAMKVETHDYIIQGASKATMAQLVEKVGGEVVHDFSAITAITASLTQEQAEQLNKTNPMIRFTSSENKDDYAGFIWGSKIPKKQYAGFIWGSKIPKKQYAGFIWGSKIPKKQYAGFIWGSKIPKKQYAGFIWGSKIPKKQYAGFIWGSKIPKKQYA